MATLPLPIPWPPHLCPPSVHPTSPHPHDHLTFVPSLSTPPLSITLLSTPPLPILMFSFTPFTTPSTWQMFSKLLNEKWNKLVKNKHGKKTRNIICPKELKSVNDVALKPVLVQGGYSQLGPGLPQVTEPYFRTPPRGKTFSPIMASTLFHSIRLNLGMIIFTGGINSLPFVKTLQEWKKKAFISALHLRGKHWKFKERPVITELETACDAPGSPQTHTAWPAEDHHQAARCWEPGDRARLPGNIFSSTMKRPDERDTAPLFK